MFYCSTKHFTDGTPNLSAYGFVGSLKQFSKAAALYPMANCPITSWKKISGIKIFLKPIRFENFVIVMIIDLH